MHTYRIYTHPAHATEAVKIGWSWPGLFLSLLWVLFHRLWWAITYLCVAVFGVMLLHAFDISEGKQDFLAFWTILVFSVLVAERGNQWRRDWFIAHGYTDHGLETAANPESAVALFHATAPLHDGEGRDGNDFAG